MHSCEIVYLLVNVGRWESIQTFYTTSIHSTKQMYFSHSSVGFNFHIELR